jgi:hypothetical protein
MAGEPPKPQSWWQTLPGALTAVAGIITAATGLIVALNQAGVFSRSEKSAPSTPTPVAISSDEKPVKPPTGGETNVNELERKLKAVNITISTGNSADEERVRGYLTGPEPAYRLLAASCLQLMGNQRLKQIGYLDMIDKHYTLLVGASNYVSANGKLNLERVKEAMVKAQNDFHGSSATSFEQIVESR